jgi:hypothetical protein
MSKYDILPCLVHKVENCQQLLVLYTLKRLTDSRILNTKFRIIEEVRKVGYLSL